MAVASVADYRTCPRLEAPATPERILMALDRLAEGGAMTVRPETIDRFRGDQAAAALVRVEQRPRLDPARGRRLDGRSARSATHRHHRRRPARVHGDRRRPRHARPRRRRARPSTSRSAPRSASAAAAAPCSRSPGSTPTAGPRLRAPAEAERRALPEVHIFGAGHVGRALAEALALLPLRPVLVDSRAEELRLAPPGVDALLTPLPEEVVRHARAGRRLRRPHPRPRARLPDRPRGAGARRRRLRRDDRLEDQAGVVPALAQAIGGTGPRYRPARLPDRRGRAARQAARGDRRLRRPPR